MSFSCMVNVPWPISAFTQQPSPTMASSSHPFRSSEKCQYNSSDRSVRGWWSLDREAFRLVLLDSPAIADPSALEGLPAADIFTVYETTTVDFISQYGSDKSISYTV